MAEYWKIATIPMPAQAECELNVPVGAKVLGAYGAVSRPDLISLYILTNGTESTEKRKFVSLVAERFTEMDGAHAPLVNSYQGPDGRRCFVFEVACAKPVAKAA